MPPKWRSLEDSQLSIGVDVGMLVGKRVSGGGGGEISECQNQLRSNRP